MIKIETDTKIRLKYFKVKMVPKMSNVFRFIGPVLIMGLIICVGCTPIFLDKTGARRYECPTGIRLMMSINEVKAILNSQGFRETQLIPQSNEFMLHYDYEKGYELIVTGVSYLGYNCIGSLHFNDDKKLWVVNLDVAMQDEWYLNRKMASIFHNEIKLKLIDVYGKPEDSLSGRVVWMNWADDFLILDVEVSDEGYGVSVGSMTIKAAETLYKMIRK